LPQLIYGGGHEVEGMSQEGFTRREFLSGIAVAGGAVFLPGAMQGELQELKAQTQDAATTKNAIAEKIAFKAQPFDLRDVRLLPGPWMDMMELNRSYLYSLPNDRLVHNFRVTARLPSDAMPLGGWEAPNVELRGHYVGHYLSACALMDASAGDLPLRNKVNELVTMLAECQQKDGYLGAYPTMFYDKLRAGEKIWAPFYTYHKIMAGLIDMYQYCGNQQALAMATRMADWADAFSKPIDEEHWQKILLIEHGGMNEASFNLYAITGKTKYCDLGYRFEHKKIFDPLATGEDKLEGNHTNTNIPKMIGAARGYELTGDERYNRISRNFYKIVVDHHSYCTGGTSNGEIWHKPDAIATQLGSDAEECCCSYNMMKLSRHLFMQEPDAKLVDYYERVLFNVRAGTQDRNGMLMYYVSLKSGGYKVFGTPFDAFWCCTGTGSEEYAKLTDSIYFHDTDSLYVNLYIASKLDWKERGLRLRQTTTFPNEEKTTLVIESTPKQATSLKLRVPYWTTGMTVKINGVPQQVTTTSSTFATLAHPWKSGDVVEIALPMSLHIAAAPDDKQVQAAMYGPLVLAARMGYEDLRTSMIYSKLGGSRSDRGMPMPEVAAQGVWFERADATPEYPLHFRSKGPGPVHSLVPLNAIMDERYSVYLKNTATS
jgi:DUF1680 family protein